MELAEMILGSFLLDSIDPDVDFFVVETKLNTTSGRRLDVARGKKGSYPSGNKGAFVSWELVPPDCIFMLGSVDCDVIVARED